jgi:hypothetical protein
MTVSPSIRLTKLIGTSLTRLYFATEKTASVTSSLERAQKEKPTGCLLGACSGQHPMGYRFSLLTLLFSGVCEII